MYKVASFYRFTDLKDPQNWKRMLLEKCQKRNLKGSLLVSPEGINGMVAGSAEEMEEFIDFLVDSFPELIFQMSCSTENPFYNLKVKNKQQVLSLGVSVEPGKISGEYVDVAKWNELLADPDVVVIDTRNDYEIAIGSFEGAIDPGTRTFREFPGWVENNLSPEKHQKIAMFCTGGIRCEKASSYLKKNGFSTVYHLKGGILRYLDEVPQAESKWRGKCFVFDRRISVGHGLREGEHDLCYACGFPLSVKDKESPHYKPGVSCHRCHHLPVDEDLGHAVELGQHNFGVGRRHRPG